MAKTARSESSQDDEDEVDQELIANILSHNQHREGGGNFGSSGNNNNDLQITAQTSEDRAYGDGSARGGAKLIKIDVPAIIIKSQDQLATNIVAE